MLTLFVNIFFMYFWNIEALEKDLKKGLSEKENMKYLVVMMLMVVVSQLSYIGVTPNFYDAIIIAMTFLYVFVEVFYLFSLNKKNKGKQFLSRYMSIGFVAAIRSIVFILLPLTILLGIAYAVVHGLDSTGPVSTTYLEVIFTILYFIGYIYLQAQSFKRLNK